MAFDVIIPSNLGRGAVAVSPSTTTFHTVAAHERTILKTLDISNATNMPKYATVYLVPDGDSPGAANILIPGVRVPAKGIFQWSGAQVINEGDAIVGMSDVAGLSFHASGGIAY